MSRREYTVRLLQAAEDDLIEILSYVAADRPSAAEILADKIEKNLGLLAKTPLLGRVPGEEELSRMRYRYLVIQDYLVFYTVEEKVILIHRILHGARDYLGLL